MLYKKKTNSGIGGKTRLSRIGSCAAPDSRIASTDFTHQSTLHSHGGHKSNKLISRLHQATKSKIASESPSRHGSIASIASQLVQNSRAKRGFSGLGGFANSQGDPIGGEMPFPRLTIAHTKRVMNGRKSSGSDAGSTKNAKLAVLSPRKNIMNSPRKSPNQMPGGNWNGPAWNNNCFAGASQMPPNQMGNCVLKNGVAMGMNINGNPMVINSMRNPMSMGSIMQNQMGNQMNCGGNQQIVPVGGDRAAQKYMNLQHAHFDYVDVWPEVEVTVQVIDCSGLNLALSTFDLDFVVILDWLDFQLIEGEHFRYDTRNGTFNLLDTVLEDNEFFNPNVRIDNSVSVETVQEDSDTFPKIKRLISCPPAEEEGEGGNSNTRVEVPWLSKTLRFKGTLVCMEMDAAWFPLDVIKLRIRIVSDFLKGMNSMGKRRRVKLIDPLLRVAYKANKIKAYVAKKGKEVDDGSVKKKSYVQRRLQKKTSHSWPSNAMTLGEMSVVGFGGVDVEDIAYQLDILLTRKWKRYWFDFVIQAMQVISAAFSLYVPFNYQAGSDTLPNRLSITLTVILTLVAFTIERPSVIEQLPYPTLHDQYERVMVAFVAIIGMENVFVFQLCVGAFPKFYSNPYTNEILEDPPYYCQEGFCGASQVDCICFAAVCFAVVFVSMLLLVWGQFYRIREVFRVHRNLHEFEYESHSRLTDHIHRMCSAFDGFSKRIMDHKFVYCNGEERECLQVLREFKLRGDHFTVSCDEGIEWAGHKLKPGDAVRILPKDEEERVREAQFQTSGNFMVNAAGAAGKMLKRMATSGHMQVGIFHSAPTSGQSNLSLKDKAKSRWDRWLNCITCGWFKGFSNTTTEYYPEGGYGDINAGTGRICRSFSKQSSGSKQSKGSRSKSASNNQLVMNSDADPSVQLMCEIRSMRVERLILCKDAFFPEEMRSKEDIVEAVAILPFSSWLSSYWVDWVNRFSEGEITKHQLQKAFKELEKAEDDESYNKKKAMLLRSSRASVTSLDVFGGRFGESGSTVDGEEGPGSEKVTLGDPQEKVYLLDVGSGEIGFYIYWQENEDVNMKAIEKYSFAKGQDFINHYFLPKPRAQAITVDDVDDNCNAKDGFNSSNKDCSDEGGGGGKKSNSSIMSGSLTSTCKSAATAVKNATMMSSAHLRKEKESEIARDKGKREFAELLIEKFELSHNSASNSGSNLGNAVEQMAMHDQRIADQCRNSERKNSESANKSEKILQSTISNGSSSKLLPPLKEKVNLPGAVYFGSPFADKDAGDKENSNPNETDKLDSSTHAQNIIDSRKSSITTSTLGDLKDSIAERFKNLDNSIPHDQSLGSTGRDFLNWSNSGGVAAKRRPRSSYNYRAGATRGMSRTNMPKVRIYVGLTGKNREYLSANPDMAEELDKWFASVQTMIRVENHIEISKINFLDFLSKPSGAKTEAAYELTATQWLVQNGDLNVDLKGIPPSIPQEKVTDDIFTGGAQVATRGRSPRFGGRSPVFFGERSPTNNRLGDKGFGIPVEANNTRNRSPIINGGSKKRSSSVDRDSSARTKEVRFAAAELKQCVENIFVDNVPRFGKKCAYWKERFLHEFRDLDMDLDSLEGLWYNLEYNINMSNNPDSKFDNADIVFLALQTLLDDSFFLRSMLRARLFMGTLSAGGGSCQVTSLAANSKQSSDKVVHDSIPFGNRSAFHESTGINGKIKPVWSTKETRMTPDMLTAWRDQLRTGIADAGVTKELRGLFVGISAVFYCAQLCGCDNRILPKSIFLEFIAKKVAEKMEKYQKPPYVPLKSEDNEFDFDGTYFDPENGSKVLVIGGDSSDTIDGLIGSSSSIENTSSNSVCNAESKLGGACNERNIGPADPLPVIKEKELREFSNLILVHTFVSEVLHESAFIVAKRNWNVVKPSENDKIVELEAEMELLQEKIFREAEVAADGADDSLVLDDGILDELMEPNASNPSGTNSTVDRMPSQIQTNPSEKSIPESRISETIPPGVMKSNATASSTVRMMTTLETIHSANDEEKAEKEDVERIFDLSDDHGVKPSDSNEASILNEASIVEEVSKDGKRISESTGDKGIEKRTRLETGSSKVEKADLAQVSGCVGAELFAGSDYAAIYEQKRQQHEKLEKGNKFVATWSFGFWLQSVRMHKKDLRKSGSDLGNVLRGDGGAQD